jgi:patatin-like phospholipase/acyl hydrolase
MDCIPAVTRPLNPRTEIIGQRVLAIEGGGTRGLATLELLRHLEKQLRGGASIATYFDVIMGTSTGGLIALLLADGKHTISEIIRLYFELKDTVFSGRKGNVNTFENLLKRLFPETPKPRLMGQLPTSPK